MKKILLSKSLLWKVIFIIAFLIIYFVFLICTYIPTTIDIPIILLIGFALFIVGFFYFFLSHSENEELSFKFKLMNEETILLIIIVLMIISFNIPPISFSQIAIDWHQVSLLNFFRASVFLLGSAFIPGSCLISIFYPNMTLHKKLNVEPFFLKLVLYPVLSFCFLGSISLVLDQLGLLRDFFSTTLFLIILSLYLIRIIFQIHTKRAKLLFKVSSNQISRNSLFIIYIAISIILITLSVQLFTKYLFGDAIRASTYSNYIGKPDTLTTDKFMSYATYWNYIIFSFSSLSGIPTMNIGAMMFPFIYLFIASVYLFMKSFLNFSKDKYAILATMFAVSFSSLFYIFQSDFAYDQISMFVFEALFNFRYKGWALILFLLSITLMTTIFKNSNELKVNYLFKSEELIIIIIAGYFLIQSLMIYFIPIIPAVTYILMMIIFSQNKHKIIGFTLIFYIVFIIFFLIFDLIYDFFFSWVAFTRLNYFFKINLIIESSDFMVKLFFNALITYFLLFTVLFLTFIFFLLYSRKPRKIQLLKIHVKPTKFMLQIFLLIFTGFFAMNILLNLIRTLRNLTFFTLFLHNFFYYIGFIGITAIYLIYFSFKKNKRQTYFLFFWSIIAFTIGLGVYISYLIRFPFSSPSNLPGRGLGTSSYWFNRLWPYSIIPLSILASFGIMNIREYFKRKRYLNLNRIRKFGQILSISVLIFFCLSNTILAGIMINNHSYKCINNEEAQMTGWISENLPHKSNILIARSQLYVFLYYTSRVNTFLIDTTIQEAKNEVDIWSTNKNIDTNCSIEYHDFYYNSKNVIEIKDNNSNGNVSLFTYLDSQRSYGMINFSLQTSNASNGFNVNFGNDPELVAITIKIENSTIYSYNGSFYQTVINISNNIWYQTSIIFNAENTYYPGLDIYQWKLIINNTEHGPYFFQNDTRIVYLNISTMDLDSNYSIYLKRFRFSWNPNYKYEYSLFPYLAAFDYLRINELYYLIIYDKKNAYQERANEYIDIWNILIPKLFSTVLYEYKGITLFKITYV